MTNARRAQKSEESQSRKLFHAAMFNIFNGCEAQLRLAELVTQAFAFVSLATAEFFEFEPPRNAAEFAEHMKKAYFPVSTNLQSQGQGTRDDFVKFNTYGQELSRRQKPRKEAMLNEFEGHAKPWVKMWKQSFTTYQSDPALRSRLQSIFNRQWERLDERMRYMAVSEIPTMEQLTAHAKHVVDTTALRMVTHYTPHTTRHTPHTTHHTPHTTHHIPHTTHHTPCTMHYQQNITYH
jgi:hypothetical protein